MLVTRALRGRHRDDLLPTPGRKSKGPPPNVCILEGKGSQKIGRKSLYSQENKSLRREKVKWSPGGATFGGAPARIVHQETTSDGTQRLRKVEPLLGGGGGGGGVGGRCGWRYGGL